VHWVCFTALFECAALYFCSCKLLWYSTEYVLLSCFNALPDIFAVMNCFVLAWSAAFCYGPVLPQVSLHKSLDSRKIFTRFGKKSLDLTFLRWILQLCLKWFNYLLYCLKTFTIFASLLKYIMLKPEKSHTNNLQAFLKIWKQYQSRSIQE